MGNIIGSKCKVCGFEKEFSYGGNKSDFHVNCPVPAINIKTGEFINPNYKETHNNKEYIFYTDDKLKGDNEDSFIFMNFDLKLNSNNNYCPNCKNYSLNFYLELLTD